MPEFSESFTAGWFDIADAQFCLRNITRSETKYFHALCGLPPDLISRLPSEIRTSHDYDALKLHLIATFEKSKPELFAKMLEKTKLTGKPSLFLQEIMTAANKVGLGEDFVRHQFLESLPPEFAAVLAVQAELTITQLGKMADNIAPYIKPKQVNQLNAKYSKQASFKSSDSDNNDDKSNIPVGLRPFHAKQRPQICRAHIYYADAARYCKPWWKHPKEGSVKILPNSRPNSPNNSRASSPSTSQRSEN